MYADHSSICKFDKADNPACKLAVGTIATMLERALKEPTSKERSSDQQALELECT